MKKFGKVFVVMAVAIMMIVVAVACGNEPSGKYTADTYKITVGDDVFEGSLADFEENEDIPEFLREGLSYFADLTIEFKDGKAISDDGEEESYRMDGDKIIFVDENGEDMTDETTSMTFKGGKITMTIDTGEGVMEIIFKK